jgi:hypothetical protein
MRLAWRTFVILYVENLGVFPPCAVAGFMSNIKVFPMAMLPGWLFAPSSNPGAKIVE